MLTGDEQLTDGEAILSGYRLADQPERFLAEIGYCPQFDAIIDHMTGMEMLVLFCRLRGIPSHQIGSEAEKWINFLGETFAGYISQPKRSTLFEITNIITCEKWSVDVISSNMKVYGFIDSVT